MISEIIPNLYVGNMHGAQKFNGSIISLYDTSLISEDVLRIYIRDQPSVNISAYFYDTNQFIDNRLERGIPVLVHCYAGMSRSVTIIIAYLMWRQGISLEDALQHMIEKNPRSSPNEGFLNQLAEYETALLM